MDIRYVWSGMDLQEAPKDATNCGLEHNRERMKSTVPSDGGWAAIKHGDFMQYTEFVAEKLDLTWI